MIYSIVKEYKIPWLINRSLYALKLKSMKLFPITEKIYEKNVEIKKIDIFEFQLNEIEEFLRELPENKKQEIISIADNALIGKIRGFSSLELDYGNPINWHINPLTGVEVDANKKWYEIPDFDPERGDIKVVWEASRFTHFFYFVRAYMLTKNIKYYEAFSMQLEDWLLSNPYSYGPNYKCSQETTLRMIGGLFAYTVFNQYHLTNKSDEKNIFELVSNSYKKVTSNFFYAYRCVKNNHTLTELLGLIIGAWCAEDSKSLEKNYRLMEEVISEQFMEDGGYIQYSFNYQRFALQIMEMLLKISNKTQISVSEESKSLILKSALLMYNLQDESGDVPNYGSNDGALIFPFSTSSYRDFTPVINTVHSLLTNQRLFNDGIYDEEILWFSENKLEYFDKKSVIRESKSYPDAGLYSLRHKDGFLMTVLSNFKSRPAQMDQFHIDLWHRGVNIFCDSGSYSYATKIGEKLALTGAHNTVKLQGIEQMNKKGPFFIYNWTKKIQMNFIENGFIGTIASKNGYVQTREIKLKKNKYFITDAVNVNKDFEIILNTPCEINVIKNGIELKVNNKLIAQIITNCTVTIEESIRSLYYLKSEKINKIILKPNTEVAKYEIILL